MPASRRPPTRGRPGAGAGPTAVLAAALFLPLAAAVAVPEAVRSAYAQAGATVVEIKFEGNRRYSTETLLLALRTKVGQKLDRALIPEDISALYEFFATVDYREEPVSPDGVRIVFVVTENPPVVEVLLVGTDGLSESEVREVIETAPGRPLAEFRVENDKRKIERLYRRKGYHFVEVNSRSESFGDGRRVVFEVLEGPHVEIDTMTFVGNRGLTKEQLLEHTASRESGLLGLAPADFVEETLRQDLLTMRQVYRYEGWLDAQVVLDKLDFSTDKSDAYVTILVTEGPAYTVGEVKLAGVEGYPGGAEALRPLIALERGRRKRHDEVVRALQAIERAYREEGFFAAVVTPEERIREGHVVDLTLRVEESSKVRVRALAIHGNVVTQDKVLRRAISVAPGDVLNQNEIDKSVRKLRSLAYFDRVAARIDTPAEGEDPNLRDVTFEVDDTAPTGNIRFAVGVSSDVGLTASLALTKRNFDWKDWPERFGDIFAGRAFTGAGQTFQLELAPGTDLSSYRLAFTEPWLFDKPLLFGWDLFLQQFTRFEYEADRRGIDLTLGRRWTFEGRTSDTVVGLTGLTRIENHKIKELDEESPPSAFLSEGSNSLISQRLTFRADNVDSTLNTTEGWSVEAGVEAGFAGDVRLFRPVAELKRHWVVARTDDERPHVLTLGTRFAYADPFGSSVDADPNLFDEEFVPIYERYLAGGGTTVRGFEFGGAGPHGEGDPFLAPRQGETSKERYRRLAAVSRSILENDGDPMGGQVQLVATAEYTFPLYEDMLRGVFFVDAGMVRDSFSSSHGLNEDDLAFVRRGIRGFNDPNYRALAAGLDFDDGPSFFSDLRVSAGFGFRIRIPFFGPTPIALDFGIPIRDEDGDDLQVVSFSIARDF